MGARFIGQEIEVQEEGAVKQPVAFAWQGRRYRIAQIEEQWVDTSTGMDSRRRGRWWQRRHRDCFRVRTEGGEVFEIYHDRGVKLAERGRWKWYLFRQLNG